MDENRMTNRDKKIMYGLKNGKVFISELDLSSYDENEMINLTIVFQATHEDLQRIHSFVNKLDVCTVVDLIRLIEG